MGYSTIILGLLLYPVLQVQNRMVQDVVLTIAVHIQLRHIASFYNNFQSFFQFSSPTIFL